MYVDFNSTYSMVYENDDLTDKTLSSLEKISDKNNNDNKIIINNTMDSESSTNKFKTRPQGVIIQDTYNNFLTPIRPKPRIDTSKFDLLEVFKNYTTLYTRFNPILLPWHYCVEMIQNKYYIFNTRPIDMTYPVDNKTALQYANNWDNDTQNFFYKNIVDISQCLHICLIGDTSLDVYPNKLYKLIGRICLRPIFGHLKIIKGSTQNVFTLNIGKRFNVNILNRFTRR